jgi:hypothetical protein
VTFPDPLVSPDVVRWAAEQVIRMHTEPPQNYRHTGRCAQCRHEGCAMLTWARRVLGLT